MAEKIDRHDGDPWSDRAPISARIIPGDGKLGVAFQYAGGKHTARPIGEREMAVVENRPHSWLPHFECLWLITEPEILKHFEGSNRVYFEYFPCPSIGMIVRSRGFVAHYLEIAIAAICDNRL